MVTGFLGAPDPVPIASIDLMMAYDSVSPSGTRPKTTCLPSSHEVTTVVTKNWEPLLRGSIRLARSHRLLRDTYVLGPALAMDRRKGLSCFNLKFSSLNFSP